MNLWTIIVIILFFVVRSVSRTKAQIRQNGRKAEAEEPPVNWDTLWTQPEEKIKKQPASAKKESRKRAAVQDDRPVIPAEPNIPVRQPYTDAEYTVTEGNEDVAPWFADSDDVRRAVINSEVLSRKFDV